MKRHLIWIITGTATIGLAVPAIAAMQPASPDDNGVPGEIRGNCDEAEHANDPECLAVGSSPTTPRTVAVPAVTSPSTSIATRTTSPDITVPRGVPSTSIDDRPTGSTAPLTSVAGRGPVGTVADVTVPTSVPGDISGPCDEAEHANDPRCTGSTPGSDDSAGRGSDDDSSGHGSDDGSDDSAGRGSDDGSDDDNSGHDIDDDSSGHGSDDGSDDDSSGHGSDDGSDDDSSGHGSDD